MFRRSAPTVLTLAAVFALAGCTPPAAGPTAWQGVVQTLASQASSGDYASAAATLDQLEADVTARRDAGTISTDEAAAILARIATVRADLSSLQPAPTVQDTPESTPEPTQSTVDDDGKSDDEGTDDPPQSPADPGGKGSGSSGPGKDGPGKGAPGGPGKKDG